MGFPVEYGWISIQQFHSVFLVQIVVVVVVVVVAATASMVGTQKHLFI
jgi:hypothetical protein